MPEEETGLALKTTGKFLMWLFLYLNLEPGAVD